MSAVSGSRWRRATWLLGLLASGAAQAQSIVPKQSDICDPAKYEVDKATLVIFLLDAKPVSRKLENWVETLSADTDFVGLSAGMRMIVDDKICERKIGDVTAPCAKDDKANLAELRQALITLLRYQPEAYRNVTNQVDPRLFFKEASARLVCRKDDNNQVVEAPGAVAQKFTLTIPVRIRAIPDGLHFARTDAAPFKPLDKATISFSRDYEKKKRTEKFAITVGYPIALKAEGRETAEIVPYVGVSRDIARVEDKDPTVSADLWRLGMVFDYTITANQMTHWIVARPEYLINDKEKSEAVGMNLTYQPVINGVLNDYHYVIPGRDDFMSFQLILDGRLNFGHFAKQGDRLPEVSHDYIRLGTQFGLALSSDYTPMPIDLIVTQTLLPALNSGPPDLHYFKAVLALGLYDDRRFGVDISYVNGRRDDLLDKEKSWTIGFGLKF